MFSCLSNTHRAISPHLLRFSQAKTNLVVLYPSNKGAARSPLLIPLSTLSQPSKKPRNPPSLQPTASSIPLQNHRRQHSSLPRNIVPCQVCHRHAEPAEKNGDGGGEGEYNKVVDCNVNGAKG